ncbi:nucleotide exchange factor GrpE [Candidatus Giovannonibacteria bacterium]|nr:nucleotide exchange factor GrpE [Candidatus Giovannonibacteria bacterium]
MKKDDESEPGIEEETEFADEDGFGNEPEKKIRKLKDETARLRKERDEYLAGWQRAKADFINARKDDEKARKAFVQFAEENILLELLFVADSLDMAVKHDPGFESAERIYRQILDILRKHGVEQLESKGKKFDPLFHEAWETADVSESSKDGEILDELQKGYLIHGKVLRPAKVKTGKYSGGKEIKN